MLRPHQQVDPNGRLDQLLWHLLDTICTQSMNGKRLYTGVMVVCVPKKSWSVETTNAAILVPARLLSTFCANVGR